MFAVAGYVATVGSWVEIESEWAEFLHKHKLPYLHMGEFAPSASVFQIPKGAGRKKERNSERCHCCFKTRVARGQRLEGGAIRTDQTGVRTRGGDDSGGSQKAGHSPADGAASIGRCTASRT